MSRAVAGLTQPVTDRLAVTDTLYRYAALIDASDLDGLRSVLTEGIVAKFGNGDALQGFDDVHAVHRRLHGELRGPAPFPKRLCRGHQR
jgi:hypothetical protein